MKIIKTNFSRIKNVDFDNLEFGKTFSDHMLKCTFKAGSWQNPTITPYQNLSFAPGTHVFHYGQAVFEGLKAYKTKNEEIILFRPRDNFKRLNQSADRLCMPSVPENVFIDGMIDLLKLDKAWIPQGQNKSLYIRPFLISTSEFIRATPANEYTFFIITSPSSSYYSDEVNLKIEEKYVRAVEGGTGFAKASGNYASAFSPTKKAQNEGFTQIIWTDAHEHKYIEESGTMNIMFRIKDKLMTPQLTESILAGITRDSVLKLAKAKNIEIEEKKISIQEIFEAHENNTLKEVFGVGTAVTINKINSITFRGQRINIKLRANEISYADQLKKDLQQIQHGIKDPYKWTIKL